MQNKDQGMENEFCKPKVKRKISLNSEKIMRKAEHNKKPSGFALHCHLDVTAYLTKSGHKQLADHQKFVTGMINGTHFKKYHKFKLFESLKLSC